MNAHAFASAFFKGESYEKLKKLLVCVSLVVMRLVYPTVMNFFCQVIKYYVNFLFTFCSHSAILQSLPSRNRRIISLVRLL